jgi:hypothetical protein
LGGDVNSVAFVTDSESVNRPVYDQRKPGLILLCGVIKKKNSSRRK